MNLSCLILSAGKQARFPRSMGPKQLLILNGESLLQRQMRQLKVYGVIPIVITQRPEIKAASEMPFEPLDHVNILDTLNSTRALWMKRNVILLGDVYYGNSAIAHIITDRAPVRFWLNGSEIFALSFDLESQADLLRCLAVCQDTGTCFHSEDRKLWHLYRAWHGADIHKHRPFDDDITVQLDSTTFDIDSLQHYLDAKTRLEPKVK